MNASISHPVVGKIKTFVRQHKAWSAVIALIILAMLYGGYRTMAAKTAPTQYVMATVTRGTIVSAVTGSGQVSTSNSVDIKPKVSGDVTGVYVSAGDAVTEGQILARLDATDALQSYNDAKNS